MPIARQPTFEFGGRPDGYTASRLPRGRPGDASASRSTGLGMAIFMNVGLQRRDVILRPCNPAPAIRGSVMRNIGKTFVLGAVMGLGVAFNLIGHAQERSTAPCCPSPSRSVPCTRSSMRATSRLRRLSDQGARRCPERGDHPDRRPGLRCDQHLSAVRSARRRSMAWPRTDCATPTSIPPRCARRRVPHSSPAAIITR